MRKYILCAVMISVMLVLGSCGSSGSGTERTAANVSTTEDTVTSSENVTDEAADTSSGILSSFATTDLDGNSVDQSVLAEADLTMINVWATYCGPCINEMPELGELSGEYKDKGVQIIGFVSDVLSSDLSIDENAVSTAKDIVNTTGAGYLHIVPSEDFYGLLYQISAVPTTFFVDKDGNQVGRIYVGAKGKDDWAKILDEMLQEVQS